MTSKTCNNQLHITIYDVKKIINMYLYTVKFCLLSFLCLIATLNVLLNPTRNIFCWQ